MAKHIHKQHVCDPLDPITLIQNYDLIRQLQDDCCRVSLLCVWRFELQRCLLHNPAMRTTALHPVFQAVLDEVTQ